MKTQDYNWTISANVPLNEAFNSISRVSEWWAKSFKGSAQKLNDEFTVNFGDTMVNFTISEYISEKKVVWYVTDCHLPWLKDQKEWKDTKIVWELSENNNSTEIKFTHVGLVPEIECYNDCKKGWDRYIKESLVKLLTENEGIPA